MRVRPTFALALAVLGCALVVAQPGAGDPIGAKQAEAQQALAKLDSLQTALEPAIQRYDLATVQLDRIRRSERENRAEALVAGHNLAAGRRAIAQRLVALYESNQSSTLEVLLGASSLDDLMSRLDATKSVTALDASVVGQVRQFSSALVRSRRALVHAKAQQDTLVASLARQKQAIEQRIAQQNALVSSLHAEIARLQAAQAAHQLALARAAQARLAAERLATASQGATVVGVSASSASGETFVPPSSHTGVVGVALAQLGKPYVWAAAGPDSFDCSGLIVYSFAQLGISLPHSSYALWDLGVPVSEDQLQPGDILFFDALGHVGMYIGGGQFVQAPHTGTVVQISPLSAAQGSYVGARRIL